MSAAGPWSRRRLHFIGVGGAGISAYARAAHALGAEISGSDAAESSYSRELAADGVLEARIGHARENVPAGDDVEVVYSSAVSADNAERVAARERGLVERPRAELLGELTALRRTIAVAGTHGKTTTASMAVHALRAAGLDPGWLIGGSIGGGLPNAHWSEDEWLVVEADESDRSMLSVDVDVAVLTNVELDHHATFSSLSQLRDAFAAFVARARRAIVVWDRPELLALTPEGDAGARAVTGEGGAAPASPDPTEVAASAEVVPFDVSGLELLAGGSRFRWRGHEVVLGVPGEHNAIDAVGALEAARLAGAGIGAASDGLTRFGGAGRRFQLLGRAAGGATVYEDYAHHPTEVVATLTGARTLAHERLIAVFQPHLYSRTRLLWREFGEALTKADMVVVLDVYPARERVEDHPDVSGMLVAEAAADAAGGRPVYWLPRFADAEPVLREMLGAGDLCVVMGAGDVDALARRLVGAPVAAGVGADA
ncbi:MAG TPA: UDP-N-acetylmuramate--L-alanine ligase [Solirubrobacteraceae bacterium]|jgi:UDP-N-acetylmuramate--alanine ligase|nr:UDP-N-acetylmuramate--L-alanine ligase [Solirubrobacteraceae bacterium]